MAISSTDSRWEYTGDGSTTGFTYSNKIFVNTELEVYSDNVLRTFTTDYTVSGAGQIDGGTVTYTTAPAGGVNVVIVRVIPDTQATVYPSGGSFPSKTVENDFDRRTIVSQQQEETFSRVMTTPVGETQRDMTLPAKAALAGKLLGFDGGSVPVAISQSDQSATSVTPTDRTSSRTLAVQATLAQSVIDVTDPDYGAVRDGVANDSTAVQSAFDHAETLTLLGYAPIVYFPAGNYLLNSQVIFTIGNASGTYGENGVVVAGAGRNATKIVAAKTNGTGCIKIIQPSLEQVITVRDMSFISLLDQETENTSSNGTMLHITSDLAPGDAGYGAKSDFTVLVENVEIGGDGATSGAIDVTGVYNIGIQIDYAWFSVVRNCFVKGAVHANAITEADANNVIFQDGIRYEHGYDAWTIDCYVLKHFERGIYHHGITTSGNSFEGGKVMNCNVVNCVDGVVVDHSTSPLPTNIYEPGFHIIGGHYNNKRHSIKITSHQQVVIEGVYAYVIDSLDYDLLPSCIFLNGVGNALVNGCEFLHPGIYTDNDNCSVAIRIEAALSRGILLTGNIFNHGGISIRIETADAQESILSFGNHWGGQQIPGVWATNVRYHDVNGVGSLTIFDAEHNAGANQDIQHFKSYKTGAGASPDSRVTRLRSDFASSTAVPLGQRSFYGLDSAGNEVLVASIRADWDDNTNGSLDSSWKFFSKAADSTIQDMTLGNGAMFGVPTGGRKGLGKTNAVEAYENNVRVASGGGTTGGSGSAGAGNQHIEITVNGTTYKVLHDGTV